MQLDLNLVSLLCVFFGGSSQNDASHINVPSISGPAAAMHTEHLEHAQADEEHHHRKCSCVWVLEGVGEPAVIAGSHHHNSGLPERVQETSVVCTIAEKVGCLAFQNLRSTLAPKKEHKITPRLSPSFHNSSATVLERQKLGKGW